jgi:hypothetical protein
MVVFAIGSDGRATPLASVRTRNEERELQLLLARNPEILPGEQIQPDDPRRWLLVRRELPVPDPATGSNRWTIDHVLADQDAVPTLVECKRFEDSRARREVVGQILEYAANGQHYWSAEDLEQYAAETAREFGQTVEEALTALDPTGGSAPEEFFAAFAHNLREGRVRLVFFMEEAPFELKSIAEFLNRQMERTEVLIIEARQFELDGRRLVIPSLFGFSEEARRAKRAAAAGDPRSAWTFETFVAAARNALSDSEFRAVDRLLTFCREQGFEISWGTGQRLGSFKVRVPGIGRRTLFCVYTNGRISWYFGYLGEEEGLRRFRDELAERLTSDFGAEFPPDLEQRFPAIPIEKWAARSAELQGVISEVVEGYRKTETG